jgi:nucleoside-diphosphate kinase
MSMQAPLVERSLVILKPDCIQRGLVGSVIQRLEQRGLKIVAMRLERVSEELARRHYAVHEGRDFFASLIEYIQSGPVVVLAVEGRDAVAVTRTTVGKTSPADAAPGTIRGDLALEIGRNLIHASDSVETARFELELWFEPERVLDYERAVDAWISEDS